jgi:hypothetical protein
MYPTRRSPERAAQAEASARVVSPFQGSNQFGVAVAVPGRCPGLDCFAPAGPRAAAAGPKSGGVGRVVSVLTFGRATGTGRVSGADLRWDDRKWFTFDTLEETVRDTRRVAAQVVGLGRTEASGAPIRDAAPALGRFTGRERRKPGWPTGYGPAVWRGPRPPCTPPSQGGEKARATPLLSPPCEGGTGGSVGVRQ